MKPKTTVTDRRWCLCHHSAFNNPCHTAPKLYKILTHMILGTNQTIIRSPISHHISESTDKALQGIKQPSHPAITEPQIC